MGEINLSPALINQTGVKGDVLMYKTNTSREFKNRGLVNPETLSLTSTVKATEGEEFDLKEAIARIASSGDEVQISIVQKETIEDVDGE